MRAVVRVLRYRLWLVWICLLLAAGVASASDNSVVADFDGDGQHDHAEVSRHEAILHIWLSTTGSTSIVRSSTPISRIVARDLDGDNRAELIASGSSTQLQVWTNGHSGFVPVRPRFATPRALSPSARCSVEDGPGDEPAADASVPLLVPFALTPRRSAPTLPAARLSADGVACRAPSPAPAPFGPRPPPLSR